RRRIRRQPGRRRSAGRIDISQPDGPPGGGAAHGGRTIMMRHAVMAIAVLSVAAPLFAPGPPGGRGGPPPTGRAGARADFTGNWVSVVSEDWRWRMITPPKGDYANIPANAEAKAVADTWDPARDTAAGEQCRAYAAPAIMREPGRLRIAWE